MKEPAYAIVVLGAAVRRGRPTATLRARLDAAHAAFEAGRAPRIIVTGYCEADAMAHYLVERGISPSVNERELYATSTHENAKNTAALVPKDARLLLCTQPSHQVRARSLFVAQGLQIELLVAAEEWSLSRALRERLAYAHHKLRGWL